MSSDTSTYLFLDRLKYLISPHEFVWFRINYIRKTSNTDMENETLRKGVTQWGYIYIRNYVWVSDIMGYISPIHSRECLRFVEIK